METENQTEDPPEHVATFAELAGILNMSRSTLYDLRRRDRRFPDRGAKGWPVYAVVHLLIVRDLEEQTDAEFNAEARRRCRDVLAAIDRGDWDAWGEDFVERMAGVMRDSLAGRFDYDAATGRTAREEEIASCLAAMDAAAKA